MSGRGAGLRALVSWSIANTPFIAAYAIHKARIVILPSIMALNSGPKSSKTYRADRHLAGNRFAL